MLSVASDQVVIAATTPHAANLKHGTCRLNSYKADPMANSSFAFQVVGIIICTNICSCHLLHCHGCDCVMHYHEN